MDVTIIVCTRNRSQALRRCLESVSIAVARSPGTAAEVIVVDNGSTDSTDAVVTDWIQSAQYPARAVKELSPGLGAARNTGVRHARGHLVAFIDDDCCVSASYLSDMVANFSDDKTPTIRGGRIELGDPADLPFGIKTDDVQIAFRFPIHPGTIALGCNMVINREAFVRLGLFDERFGSGARFKAAEESEFFYRAYLNNIPVVYVPNMTVFHHHGRKSEELARLHYASYSIGTGAMYAKHMFSRGGLVKHLYWDLRKAAAEAIGLAAPDKGALFSRSCMMLQIFKGMALFWVTLPMDVLRSRRREAFLPKVASNSL